MSDAIEAVVFDLGGVLVDWNPRHLYRKLFDDEAAMEAFLTDVCSPEWHAEIDRGRPMAEAVADLARQYPDLAPLIEAYDARWDEMFEGAIDGSVDILVKMRAQGWPLYALTNFPGERFERFMHSFPFVEAFKGIIVSGQEGTIKPEAEIFRRLSTRFDLAPGRTLFIDDLPANVAAARRFGFQAVHFTSPEGLQRDLETVGLL